MAGNITFVNGQGGLGRPLAGEDFISGLLYYTATLPSGYSSSDRIKKFFSVADTISNNNQLSLIEQIKEIEQQNK